MDTKLIMVVCLAASLSLGGFLTFESVAEEPVKINIADNGKAMMTVVVSAEQTLPEKKAAEELAGYLKKITGADFSIQQESEFKGDSPALYVGQTEYARGNGVDFARLGDEEWVVRSDKNNIVIVGGRPRGTLYGVYHFLEDELGVRWWTPHAESVPKIPSLVMGKLDRKGKPVFAYREIYLMSEKDTSEFFVRNRFSPGPYDLPAYGARILFGGSHASHTMYTFLGKSDEVKKLYQEHPDWFPLIDGTRKMDTLCQDGSAQTQLCLTNPGLREFFLERVRVAVKEDKAKASRQGIQPAMFYPIDQNDCYDGFCKCDKCMEIVEREGATSGIMLDFTNYIAENMKNETDATFLMMAEHVLEKPPRLMKALPNVGLRLCDTTSNMIHPWTHPDNAKHRANIDGWAKVTGKIVIWDYSIHFGTEFSGINLPFPSERTLAPDLRYLAEHNGYGVFFEHEEVIRGDMRDLKIWLEAKLAENPYLDYDALLKDFTDGFYGLAGQYVRKYLALLEKSADKVEAKLTYYPKLSDFTYLDGDFVFPSMEIFDDAEKAVGDNPELLRRIRHARLSLDRAFLLKANKLKSEWRKQGRNEKEFPVDPGQVLARYKKTWQNAFELKFPAGKYEKTRNDEKKNNEKFLYGIANRKSFPMPEQFNDIPEGRVFDFNARLFSTYVDYWEMVEDPGTVVGGAWKASIEDVQNYAKKKPEYLGVKYFCNPFTWAVCPTMAGTIKETTEVPDKRKDGYNWYKLNSTFELCKESILEVFVGVVVTFEGVVSDNSELGQEYEIWISLKFEGSGFAPDGQPNKDVSIYFDRVIVIQKTSNKDKL